MTTTVTRFSVITCTRTQYERTISSFESLGDELEEECKFGGDIQKITIDRLRHTSRLRRDESDCENAVAVYFPYKCHPKTINLSKQAPRFYASESFFPPQLVTRYLRSNVFRPYFRHLIRLHVNSSSKLI